MSNDTSSSPPTAPRWQPLTSIQRRVVGVLIEKAKTTPEAYPLTLNALTNGCNQKSNRAPHMELSSEEVERVLDELREMGAVTEVQSGGRVPKFRHYMYDWLGVDKAELAVMAELLLRGEQSIGELRGRAARMEPIADLDALRPILDSLHSKRLIVMLTPPGRGQTLTHNLYTPERLAELTAQYASGRPAAEVTPSRPTASAGTGIPAVQFAALQAEVTELREALLRLQDEVAALRGGT